MPNEPQLRLLLLLHWAYTRLQFISRNLQFDYLVGKDGIDLVERELSTTVFGSEWIFVRWYNRQVTRPTNPEKIKIATSTPIKAIWPVSIAEIKTVLKNIRSTKTIEKQIKEKQPSKLTNAIRLSRANQM